jgi:hypothetical protein
VYSVSKTRLFLAVGIATAGLVLIPAATASADTTIDGPINLANATSFAALGALGVTSATPSSFSGDVGVSPGTSMTGILPVDVTNGSIHNNDSQAAAAQASLTAAYLVAQSLTPQQSNMTELGGLSLTPGVYSGGALQVTGDLTLTGSATDVWVFQASSSLTTGSGSHIILAGQASACNVFWQVDSSATLGSGSHFVGTLMSKQSISVVNGTTVDGRLLANFAALTMDNTSIVAPTGCADASGTTVTTTPDANGSDGSGGTENGSGGGGSGGLSPAATGSGSGSSLAFTGVDAAPFLGGASVLFASGIALLLLSRRRRTRRS